MNKPVVYNPDFNFNNQVRPSPAAQAPQTDDNHGQDFLASLRDALIILYCLEAILVMSLGIGYVLLFYGFGLLASLASRGH
jgi:hypothetical protein